MSESNPEQLHIGLIALQQGDHFDLQWRTETESTTSIGLVGFFGGKLLAHETSVEAASRELQEETNARIKPKHLEQIDHIELPANQTRSGRLIIADIFLGELDATMPVYARKGKLVKWTLEQVMSSISSLTPVTRSFFERNY